MFAAVLFVAIAYAFWPLASDWITEWQGYVMGFVIGGVGLAFMALVVFVTDWPLAIELIIPWPSSQSRGGGLPARGSSVIVFETYAEKGNSRSKTSPKTRRAAIAS